MLSLAGQLIFDGLAMGLVFVILATGLVLIMSISRILFMAYGMFYMIGAYAVWFSMDQFRLPYFIALITGVMLTCLLGMLSYIMIFRRLQINEAGFLATLLASMGLSRFLSQGGVLVFGSQPRRIQSVFTGQVEILNIFIATDKLAIILLGVSITLILFYVYEKTSLGRSMRAVAFNPTISSIHGVDPSRIYMLTLGIGTALAGFAGGILAPTYGISASMGSNILWSVFLMTMLGGMGSLLGAVFAGVVIGQMLSFGQYFIGASIQIIIFLLIGIVLYFRPSGLMGREIDIGF